MNSEESEAMDLIQLLLQQFQPEREKADPGFEYSKQIARIGNATSLDEAIFFFENSSPLVRTYKFVFSSDAGTTPGFSVNKRFSKTAAVRSLFPTEKVFVIDTNTLSEMSAGNSRFQIDYSISLDNQALSYLEPYFGDKRSRIPDDMVEVFEFISRPEVFVDPQPYIEENLHNLTSPENIEKIRNKLKAYEILRTLDTEELKKNHTIRTTLSEKRLTANTHKLVASMIKTRSNKQIVSRMAMRYVLIYCQLLKMMVVQMNSPKRSTHNKLVDYLQFCHEELKALSFREISVAKKYFAEANNFLFFKDIQKNRKGLFQAINGMVWDLWHLRQLEENMVLAAKDKIRYFFPAILTFDKGLNQVMDLHPLKSIALNKSVNKTVPFYQGNFIDDITDGVSNNMAAIGYYFKEEQILWRDRERIKKKNNKTEKEYIQNLVLTLERELEEISEIKRPANLSNWYIAKPKSR